MSIDLWKRSGPEDQLIKYLPLPEGFGVPVPSPVNGMGRGLFWRLVYHNPFPIMIAPGGAEHGMLPDLLPGHPPHPDRFSDG